MMLRGYKVARPRNEHELSIDGRDSILSFTMTMFCMGLLLLDTRGLTDNWNWFSTLFFLSMFTLVVFYPASLALNIISVRGTFTYVAPPYARVLGWSGLALNVVQLWFFWHVIGLALSFHFGT